ncbi:MAG: signal peptidase I [Spirochaetota bacterium]|jgi:signal peptidase I|nr:signal peptidase I [Spirochaetota bacterium]
MSTYHYKKKIEKGKIFKDVILIYSITVLFVLLFNSILLQAFKIPTDSMTPTLKEGGRILVDKFSVGPKYPLTDKRIFDATESQVQRGDIIAFYSNEYYNKGAFYRSITTFLYTVSFTLIDIPALAKHYDSSVYVKRVVGLPGDKIKFRLINDEVILTINGIPEKEIIPKEYRIISENRTNSKLLTTMIIQNEYVLKDNEYYVLGDNRISSSDSRIWGGVKKEQILGKVIFKYWPLDVFGVAR